MNNFIRRYSCLGGQPLHVVTPLAILLFLFTTMANSADKSHWILREGKGYVLCEALLKIANRKPRPPNSVDPSIPWKALFAIKGISEPPWEELDPAQHEEWFLKAWEFYDHPNPPDKNHCLNPLEYWFSVAYPMAERGPEFEARYCADTSPEARRPLTLETYRKFIAIGGKLKLYRFDWGGERSAMLFQYDMPTKVASTTSNFTISYFADFSGPITTWTGPSTRLLLYRGQPFIFEGYGTHRVRPLGSTEWHCEIDFRLS